jgi:hypothetical protein
VKENAAFHALSSQYGQVSQLFGLLIQYAGFVQPLHGCHPGLSMLWGFLQERLK